MNRNMLFFALATTAALIAVSCNLLEREKNDVHMLLPKQLEREKKNANSREINQEIRSVGNKPQQQEAQIITQYDTKKLDEEVREEARLMHKDPTTYRKQVRYDQNGTIVYRALGMHIIIGPDREEIFLPDEL
jgi:hypothetical protein